MRPILQTGLLGILLALAPIGSTALADDTAEATTRKAPQRLPVVTGTAKINRADQHQGPGENASDQIRCSAEIASEAPTAIQIAAEQPPAKTLPSSKPPTRWLRSTTSTAASEAARRLIVQASNDYRAGAWLSAETTAWNSLRMTAEGIDLADREQGVASGGRSLRGSLASLEAARCAIREARDFSGTYGEIDAEAIARMARSHVSAILDDQSAEGISATDASDRYLDEARITLATIATRSVEAAQAMDLLAAIYLKRADSKTLPSATALCLRRAALQGQPGNASLASRLGMHLADVGLLQEARWALEHSLLLASDEPTADALAKVLRRSGHDEDANRLVATMKNRAHSDSSAPGESPGPRIPEITELSPSEFAAISQPVMSVSRRSSSIEASPASARTNATRVATGQRTTDPNSSVPDSQSQEIEQPQPQQQDNKPGVVRRFFGSFKRIW